MAVVTSSPSILARSKSATRVATALFISPFLLTFRLTGFLTRDKNDSQDTFACGRSSSRVL